MCLVLTILFYQVLFIPREVVDGSYGKFVVVIAHIEEVTVTGLQCESVLVYWFAFVVLDIAEGKDVVTALATRCACGIMSVAIVHIIEPHFETGTGR